MSATTWIIAAARIVPARGSIVRREGVASWRSIVAWGAIALGLAAGTLAPRPAAAAELIVLERPGCVWCARWEDEVGGAYAHTPEGRRAPLRRVDITKPWPRDLQSVNLDAFTPTFVLVDGGREIGRLRGYPGNAFFWSLLDEMLAALP